MREENRFRRKYYSKGEQKGRRLGQIKIEEKHVNMFTGSKNGRFAFELRF